MGIGAILLFALFCIELSLVVHGADITTFEDPASDVLQFSEGSGNGTGGNRTKAESSFTNWLQTIQKQSSSKNVGDMSTRNQNVLSNGEDGPRVITVAKTGVANFRRVQDAIDSIPVNNEHRVVIYIQSGIYKEKVIIPETKPYITFQGQGKRSTIITWHDSAYTKDKKGRNIGTFKSASVAVESDYFVAANISFENTSHYPNAEFEYRQAVAMRISGDMATFYSCGFFGHQDTLFDEKGRHYFRQCTIKGTVDYIFGNGRSLYERCAIRSLTRFGAITAQGRAEADEQTGFAFLKCRINGPGNPYLGRAWRNFSRVVYIQSKFNMELHPDAWSDFGVPARKMTSFYGVYKCNGLGAQTAIQSGWTKELSPQEAKPFIDKSFINGEVWIRPSADITLDPKRLQSIIEQMSISKDRH